MAKTCPDHELLSVYFDGELSSPWKEKMEEHISNCALCRQKLEEYRKFSLAYSDEEEMLLKTAQENVWKKLQYNLPAVIPMPQRNIWRGRISIPIPAAAAIALLFSALTFFAFWARPSQEEIPRMMILASEAEYDLQESFPFGAMEDLLLYLSSRDNGDILRLPETRNFVSFREPAVIRAADRPRRNNQNWRSP